MSSKANNNKTVIAADTALARKVLKQRPEDMHKGQAGRVLIIAGQTGMAGAAVLAARGTLYSGAGLVKVSAPKDLFDIIQISAPEAMCIGRKGFEKENPDPDYDLSKYDAIAIGPGFGTGEDKTRLLRKVLEGFDGPVVIDADGLNCLCEEITMLKDRKGTTVITPHPGEADRILKTAGTDGYDKDDREGTASRLASIAGTKDRSGSELIVLLKGKGTLVASGNDMYLIGTGNPGMATGGSGDVLTGLILSLIGQARAGARSNAKEGTNRFMDAGYLETVACAAYIHGLAGDIAAADKGQYGMTSADIADAIPAAIKEVTGI